MNNSTATTFSLTPANVEPEHPPRSTGPPIVLLPESIHWRPPVIGSAMPLGLASVGMCAFCNGLYNLRVFGINAVSSGNYYLLGLTFFYGGFGQATTGIIEFLGGNSFGGTVFFSFGMYWLSYGALLLPFFGISSISTKIISQSPGYPSETTIDPDYQTVLGIISLGWTIFTFLLWTTVVRTNLASSALFLILDIVQLLETVACFTMVPPGSQLRKVSGALSVIGGILSWYYTIALLSKKSLGSLYELPIGEMTAKDVEKNV